MTLGLILSFGTIFFPTGNADFNLLTFTLGLGLSLVGACLWMAWKCLGAAQKLAERIRTRIQ